MAMGLPPEVCQDSYGGLGRQTGKISAVTQLYFRKISLCSEACTFLFELFLTAFPAWLPC